MLTQPSQHNCASILSLLSQAETSCSPHGGCQHLVTAWIAAYPQRCFYSALLCDYLPLVSSPAAFTAVFKREGKEQWTDGHLRGLLVVGTGGVVLAPVLACSILSRQIPLWFLMKFPFSWLAHCKNPFHSKFCLERVTPTQMAALQLSFMLGFFMFLFALPSGEIRVCQKHIPDLERNWAVRIFCFFSKLGMQRAISFYQFTRDCVTFSFWLSFHVVHLFVFLREKVQLSLRVVLAMFCYFLETVWVVPLFPDKCQCSALESCWSHLIRVGCFLPSK